MKINDIRKALYKQKPDALFQYIDFRDEQHVAHYSVLLDHYLIWYHIPINEMSKTTFKKVMPAQLLNKYLDEKELIKTYNLIDK